MKKKNIIACLSLVSAASIVAGSCILLSKNNKLFAANGAVNYWTIEFGAENLLDTDRATDGAEIESYYETGTAVVKTKENQNDITIGYNNIYRYDFNGIKWLETKANGEGYIYNVSPIYSMIGFRVYFTGTFTMEWGWDEVDGNVNYEASETVSHYAQYTDFYFNDQKPNYFRFKNITDVGKAMATFRIQLDRACTPGVNPNA